eukprot:1462628-Pleurochrysis_carterae.AAC.1
MPLASVTTVTTPSSPRAGRRFLAPMVLPRCRPRGPSPRRAARPIRAPPCLPASAPPSRRLASSRSPLRLSAFVLPRSPRAGAPSVPGAPALGSRGRRRETALCASARARVQSPPRASSPPLLG